MRDLIAQHPQVLPQVALVFFFSIAVLVCWHVFTDRRKGHLRRMESLPLDDGQQERHHG